VNTKRTWDAAEFAARLRRRGLSQEDFARVSGLHHTSVSHFISGRRVPSNGMLRRIATALDAIPELPDVAALVGMR
jgi:gp16 family phage-associated protein